MPSISPAKPPPMMVILFTPIFFLVLFLFLFLVLFGR
jgi:hypothetical protein